MDPSVFLLKREEIQQRMEARRQEASASGGYSARRLLPWLLTTGLSLVTGLRATPTNYNWLGSAAAAVVLPAILGFARRKTEPRGFVHRILRLVFPSQEL